jgi:hypothetical protein
VLGEPRTARHDPERDESPIGGKIGYFRCFLQNIAAKSTGSPNSHGEARTKDLVDRHKQRITPWCWSFLAASIEKQENIAQSHIIEPPVARACP